jgi:hypothetical protein
VLLRPLQVEALENAASRIEQNDIGLWLVDGVGIERDQIAADPYWFQASQIRGATLAAPPAE